MTKAAKIIASLQRRARQAGTAWERQELLQRARDIARREARADYRAKAGPVARDMAGAY